MACAEDAHVGDTSEVFLTIQGVPSAIEDVVEGIISRAVKQVGFRSTYLINGSIYNKISIKLVNMKNLLHYSLSESN